MPPKFGRRAEEDPQGANAHNNNTTNTTGTSSNSSPETLKVTHGTSKGASGRRPPDEVVHKDKLRNLDDGVDENSRQQALEKAKEEKERLVNRVAEVPVGYNVSMPKLSELDISNLWNDFLQVIHQDLDMSALTACLSQHLDDEDAPWNPEMLLVQLTSDMLDAAEGAGGAEIPPPQQAEREAVGEARRRRKVLLEDAGDPPEGPSHRRRPPHDPPAEENDGKSPPRGVKSAGGKNAWTGQEGKTAAARPSKSAQPSHAAKPAENAKAPQSGATATGDAKKHSVSSKPVAPKSEKTKEPVKK